MQSLHDFAKMNFTHDKHILQCNDMSATKMFLLILFDILSHITIQNVPYHIRLCDCEWFSGLTQEYEYVL